MAKATDMTKAADIEMTALPDALPNFDTWAEEQTGFAPYWNPEENKWIFAQVIERDENDPQFIRYLMRAGVDTECKRGPADAAEDVLVKKGEYFTISVYYSLRALFDLYLETGHKPFIKITAIKEVKTKTVGQTCWTWKVQSSPADKKKMDAFRAQMKQMSDGGEFPPKAMNA